MPFSLHFLCLTEQNVLYLGGNIETKLFTKKRVFMGINCHEHDGSNITEEIMSHMPYAILSVALSLIGAAFMSFFTYGADPQMLHEGTHTLFHAFHFLHIVFAATGAMITFFRFSKDIVRGFIVCTISTVVFCILSDVLFPYISGVLLGADMDLHICFVSELTNVVPFLLVGLLNGWVLHKNKNGLQSYYSVWAHFMHILVSAFASLIYMIGNGFDEWYLYFGPIFILMIIAVVVPCTMSDLVVPIAFSGAKK